MLRTSPPSVPTFTPYQAFPELTGVQERPVSEAKGWGPYVNNGGTCIGVAGDDFVVIGADTRMSVGYAINTRNSPKYIKLTDKCILVSSGMQADIATLHKTLVSRLVWYEHQNGKKMSTPAIAQLLGNTLYYRRFFPYYAFNVLGGIDEDGKAAVYSYDAVGSFERCQYSSSGTGQTLVQPLLDNQVGFRNQNNVANRKLNMEDTVALVKDAFTSVGERDIYTGDYVNIFTITKEGIKEEPVFRLKFD
eukprot:TRINITY_DN3479_c0_g1_i1.p1 TRINITY_DN3479_c0_g1~~TRINITY_DN3479_c0_g1_i1.p1  ORF type:complete len:248 (-),score=55.92 TRINITY_DN3479_c0_g1_i1:152-895(-)